MIGIVAPLGEHGLAEVDDDGVFLNLEVAAMVRARLDEEAQRRWCATLLELLYEAMPAEVDDVRTWPRVEPLLSHALQAIDFATALGLHREAVVGMLAQIAQYTQSRGRLIEACDLAQRAMADVELVAGTSLEGVVNHTLGCALGDLGEIDEARPLLERALAVREELRAPGHPEVILSRAELADLLVEFDELDSALGQLERALADFGDRAYDRSGAAALRMFGWVLLKRGDESALSESKKALEVTMGVCGVDHPDTVAGRIGFAAALDDAGKLEEALSELEEALAVATAARGDEHPQVAVAHSNLGSVLRSLGAGYQARSHFEAALAIGEATLPDDHRGLWIRHRKLAVLLSELGESDEAREHAEAALAITGRSVGRDSSRFAGDLAVLAGARASRGELSAARDSYRRALATAEAALGIEHEDVALYALQLARIERRLVDLSAARTHASRAVRTYQQIDEDNVRAAIARVDLALVLVRQGEELEAACKELGRDDEAAVAGDAAQSALVGALESVLAEGDLGAKLAVAGAAAERLPQLSFTALEQAESILAQAPRVDDALRVGYAWHHLGRAQRGGNHSAEVERAFKAAVPLLESRPQSQGVALHDLAQIHSAAHRYAEAAALFRRAADRKREAGENPRDLATTLLAMGRALEMEKQFSQALAAHGERMEILAALPERDLQAEGVTLHDIGDVRRAEGKLEMAAGLYRQAVECKRDAEGSPRDLAISLQALGRALAALERHEDALAAYKERMEILAALPERDLQAEGVTLHDIADAHRAQGDFEAAANLYRQAAEKKREGAGKANSSARDLTVTLLALGRALLLDEKYDEAHKALQDCVKILTTLPERDPQAEGVAYHDIAEVHRAKGEYQKARDFYRLGAESKREAGENQRDLAITLLALARSELMAFEDAAAAIAASTEAVDLLRGGVGLEISWLVAALALRAEALLEHGEAGPALASLREAEREWSDRQDEPHALAHLKELSSTAYLALGREEEAAVARDEMESLRRAAEKAPS
jgi:tetratricopeptide (TPR) repeat protein